MNPPMSRTSIVKVLHMAAATVRTAATAEGIGEEIVVGAADEGAVVDATAADTAGMVAAGGTKSLRHGSARIFTDQKKRLRLRLRPFFILVSDGPDLGLLRDWRSPGLTFAQRSFMGVARNLATAAVPGVGMLRLRRSSASLHSGCAQHDIGLGAFRKSLWPDWQEGLARDDSKRCTANSESLLKATLPCMSDTHCASSSNASQPIPLHKTGKQGGADGTSDVVMAFRPVETRVSERAS